ncbi:phenylpropionate dioxygenase-like ring-hydroxylating dioxygenase large terminal subunit [Bradyrhizobium macuxiense]|uniref:Phenylpropionate dioxygenase-like ring-hydroxylating dioxygenase large terminal subunit n=1 Tax=Bradyrhizobium macuxiense TaxID=1755647 RepID=A0A560KV55_9BRAD|nr:aromatic ring-hydroxylating dioxygenase subunit alpha [Bradyrhizobium macuxiense]TWB85964.1 phenylpropionate dioxygenase-like ring-hydroxylating dioxygenase large terminal subunit [Bradyrhizobium macuxiense]
MSQTSPCLAGTMSQSERLLLDTLSNVAQTRATHAMPGGFYTSQEFAQLERERVFRQSWVCIGHVGELPANGDYFTVDLVGEPLLVQRDGKGEIRVFANVCSHRGNLVAIGRGNARIHVCGYHAWSFDLEGKLKRAPLMQDCKDLDAAKCSLPTISTTIWQNFIFVNLDGTAAPLCETLAPLESHIRDYNLKERGLHYSREEVWNTNWKCLAENFMEGYHLNATHPKTLGTRSGSELSEHVPGNGHFSAYRSHYKPGAPQRTEAFTLGRGNAPQREAVAPSREESPFSFNFSVFPNLLVSSNFHRTAYVCLMPLSIDRVELRLGFDGPGEKPESDRLAEFIAYVDQVNSEDRAKLETLQHGLRSSFYKPGPLAPENYEGTVRDFYSFVAKRICN